MKPKDIELAIAQLNYATQTLEDIYTDNGGEETEETMNEQERIDTLRELLEGEGIDSLGRWLKAKEDEAAALKAEKDHIARKQKAVEGTVTYIKAELFKVLSALGTDKVKGLSYGFTAYTSRKVTADKEVLKERYQQTALDAIHAAGVPDCVGVSLTASSSAVVGELPDFFNVEESETVKFSKPRKSE